MRKISYVPSVGKLSSSKPVLITIRRGMKTEEISNVQNALLRRLLRVSMFRPFVCAKKLSSYFLTKTHVVGNQKNCLNETVLLSTKNIMLKLIGKKIYCVYLDLCCCMHPEIWLIQLSVDWPIVLLLAIIYLFPPFTTISYAHYLCLHTLESLYCKQYRPRSDCSERFPEYTQYFSTKACMLWVLIRSIS